MRAIGTLIGVSPGIVDLVGIVAGFYASVGKGLSVLLIPPMVCGWVSG